LIVFNRDLPINSPANVFQELTFFKDVGKFGKRRWIHVRMRIVLVIRVGFYNSVSKCFLWDHKGPK